MESDEDIERSAAFDEMLRTRAAAPLENENQPKHLNTIRLLHEVFRGSSVEPANDTTDTTTLSSTDADLDQLSRLPERIGRFEILRLLGRGGFGTVYLAEDPLLNRQVALKAIHSHLLLDPNMRRRALREREAMARLQHPNIIPVWEASEDGDQLFIVSEYCAGKSLAQWLVEHSGPLDGGMVAQWVYRLADAVAHSHSRGVIHRDLKPGNILLDPQLHLPASEPRPMERLEPRLSDFGLAKILDKSNQEDASILTQAGLFVGSLEYASAEQVKGHSAAIGPATDVYALGVLLFQLLTGQLPHVATSRYELARRICEDHARFSNEQAAIVPKDLQAITLRAMARDKSDRYASADDLRDDLGRYLQGQPVLARPVSLLEKLTRLAYRRPAVTLLASACCLLALMYFYNLVISNHRLSVQSQELKLALEHANEQRTEAEHQRLIAQDGQKSLNKLVYRDLLKSAFDQWQQHNYIGLHDSLERLRAPHPPTMEWHHLRMQLDSSYHVFDLQDDPVQALAWHAADRQLLSIGESGRLRRWLPSSPAAIADQQTAIGAHSIAIHPDGQTIAMPEYLSADKNSPSVSPGSKASRITFWNSRDAGRLDVILQNHSRTVESLEYSPDGRWLAGGPRYANVIITDLENQESFALKSLRRNRQVLFSPESDRVAINSAHGMIGIHDLNSRQLITTIKNEQSGDLKAIYSMAWLPGRNAIVVNGGNERLQVYSAEDGRRIADAHADMEAESIAVSPDCRRVVLGDNQGFARLFDIEALMAGSEDKIALSPVMRVLNGKITDMIFIDDDRFVAADAEGNMIQWRAPASPVALELAESYRKLTWHDDQHLWLFSRTGDPIRFAELDGNSLKLSSESPSHVELEIARTQNARHIAMASMSGKITIVDAQTGRPVSSCQLPTANAIAQHVPVSDVLQFSADGQLLFTTGENNSLCVIRVRDGEIVWSKSFTNSGYSLAEDAAHNTLFWGGGFEELMFFETTAGKLRGEHVAGNGSVSLLVNNYRNELISGHQDGTVRTRSLKLDSSPVIHRLSRTGIMALAMTPDHRTLITGDEEGVVRIADDEIVPFGILYRSNLVNPEVTSMQWSPDRKRLAALIMSMKNTNSEVVIFESGLTGNAQ